MSREIERKFLIKKLPENLENFKFEKIHQGYLNIENRDFEVRFRKKGTQYFQAIKKGTGLNREEVEISISKEQFVHLWPLTENYRIIKRRYQIPYRNYTIELDLYEDRFNGLIACEVEFSSEKEALNFDKPQWFGEEITDEISLQNNHLALHGINKIILKKYGIKLSTEDVYYQSGVIPVRNNEEVLIITNTKKQWIFPKGIIEFGLTSGESALKEAYEEAGISGNIVDSFDHYEYEKWNGICHVEMFLMDNIKQLEQWPENFRKRKWVKFNKLPEYIKKPELQPIINRLLEKYDK